MLKNFPDLETLLKEINELKSAQNLLEEIWLEVGPYGREISDALRYKLQDFFNFDDSE